MLINTDEEEERLKRIYNLENVKKEYWIFAKNDWQNCTKTISSVYKVFGGDNN